MHVHHNAEEMMHLHKTLAVLVAALAVSMLAGCPAGPCREKTQCTTGCADLSSDAMSCGACGNACPFNDACYHGVCRPLVSVGPASNKTDILFMVDNSNGMSAKSEQLKVRFGGFAQLFSDAAAAGSPADLDIAVVTSDYGAGKTGSPGCQPSPGGQQGRMQALGVAAPQGCLPPTGNVNFVHFDFDATHTNTSNLPASQNLAQTFTCMASVGSMGCGFEHQLESVFAALHNPIPDNKDFLRDDARLAIVFVTDEDDSSAPPDSDMFDKSASAMWGYEDSYRQTRWGIMCDPDGSLPPYGDSGGPLSNCVPATNPPGAEYDVQRYIDFFTNPASKGGVKGNPVDVSMFAIDGPGPMEGGTVQVILSNPSTTGGQPYTPCSPLNEGSNPACVPVLQHSCQNPKNPVFDGDPAVRLNTVVRSARGGSFIGSICDDDYSASLRTIAQKILAAGIPGCLLGAPANAAKPDCLVEDVTENGDGTQTSTLITSCASSGGAPPCWSIAAQAKCSVVSPVALQLSVTRSPGAPPLPPHTATTAVCVTQ